MNLLERETSLKIWQINFFSKKILGKIFYLRDENHNFFVPKLSMLKGREVARFRPRSRGGGLRDLRHCPQHSCAEVQKCSTMNRNHIIVNLHDPVEVDSDSGTTTCSDIIMTRTVAAAPRVMSRASDRPSFPPPPPDMRVQRNVSRVSCPEDRVQSIVPRGSCRQGTKVVPLQERVRERTTNDREN